MRQDRDPFSPPHKASLSTRLYSPRTHNPPLWSFYLRTPPPLAALPHPSMSLTAALLHPRHTLLLSAKMLPLSSGMWLSGFTLANDTPALKRSDGFRHRCCYGREAKVMLQMVSLGPTLSALRCFFFAQHPRRRSALHYLLPQGRVGSYTEFVAMLLQVCLSITNDVVMTSLSLM
jgi:hypothetical protein